jgi:hypothetical protein
MIIKKLIITKLGRHYWKEVKHIKRLGVFIVDFNGVTTMFYNKSIVPNYGSLVDIIEELCRQKVRDTKIESVLN